MKTDPLLSLTPLYHPHAPTHTNSQRVQISKTVKNHPSNLSHPTQPPTCTRTANVLQVNHLPTIPEAHNFHGSSAVPDILAGLVWCLCVLGFGAGVGICFGAQGTWEDISQAEIKAEAASYFRIFSCNGDKMEARATYHCFM